MSEQVEPARDIPCPHCKRKFGTRQALMQHDHAVHPWAAEARYKRRVRRKLTSVVKQAPPNIDADWDGKCENCGESPVVPETGMCGPCTFGEAETAGGNW